MYCSTFISSAYGGQQVLSDDNEENALTALRIIFDLHKSYRPSLESQVQVFDKIFFSVLISMQPFLELVQKIFTNVRASVSAIFVVPEVSYSPARGSASLPQAEIAYSVPPSTQSDANDAVLVESRGNMPPPMEISDSRPGVGVSSGNPLLPPRDQRTPPQSHRGGTPLLKSLESFKVLTECPLIVMLMFQLYPKFINVNIPQMLPVMMEVLALQVSTEAAKLHRSRFKEFQAAQVSFVFCFVLVLN